MLKKHPLDFLNDADSALRAARGAWPRAPRPPSCAPVLRIIHRVIAGFLLKQAGLKRAIANAGAVTLIQRFGSAA